jgi:hypothetical protein
VEQNPYKNLDLGAVVLELARLYDAPRVKLKWIIRKPVVGFQYQ